MARHPTEQEMQSFDFTKYRLSRKQAIRLNCLDCMGFQENEVKNCTITSCPMHPYRMSGAKDIPLILLQNLRLNPARIETDKVSETQEIGGHPSKSERRNA